MYSPLPLSCSRSENEYQATAASLNTGNLLLEAACFIISDTSACKINLVARERDLSLMRQAVTNGRASHMSCLVPEVDPPPSPVATTR